MKNRAAITEPQNERYVSRTNGAAGPLVNSVRRRIQTEPGIKKTSSLARLHNVISGLLGTGRGPSVTYLYQDEPSHAWAKELHARILRLAVTEGVRATWWKIHDLHIPGILAGAVSTAVRADIIVVAARSEGLPLPFYVWANSWWPHRADAPGTLVTLVGMPDPLASAPSSISHYLGALAQQARLKFLPVEPWSLSFSPSAGQNGSSPVNGAPVNGFAHPVPAGRPVNGANGRPSVPVRRTRSPVAKN